MISKTLSNRLEMPHAKVRMSKSYRYAYYVYMFTCRYVIMNIKKMRTNEYPQAYVLPTVHKRRIQIVLEIK